MQMRFRVTSPSAPSIERRRSLRSRSIVANLEGSRKRKGDFVTSMKYSVCQLLIGTLCVDPCR